MSRPWPVNVAFPLTSKATGMRKRRVEPLSPQSRSGAGPASTMALPRPRTRTVPLSKSSIRAPRAERHRRVARISWESARL